jgi:hypothetical protein
MISGAVTRSAAARIHRFRPATRAILWYPLASALATAGFWLWAWSDCAPAHDPRACRADIAEAALWFFLAVLGIGLTILAVIWILSAIVGRARGRAVGFGPTAEGGSRARATDRDRAMGSGSEERVSARRSERH